MSSKLRPRWFAPSSIPPILLLTVVTSFAFNHALISTQRKKQLGQHRIQTTLLSDTIDYNSRLLYHLNPPSSWLSFSKAKKEEQEWIQDERESLLRRWKALGLDPIKYHLLPSAPRETVEEENEKRITPKQVTWSEIFLGSKEKRSSLTERWQKVTAGIKDSFTLNNTAPTQTEEEDKELEELSKLWSKAVQE